MKKVYYNSIIMLLTALIAFSACKKQNETAVVSPEAEINALADQAADGMDSEEIYSDNPDMGIYMKNDGIPADFLVEENDLEGKDTLRQKIREHSFIACLKGLKLTETQVSEIKRDIKAYRECKENAIMRAKEIYRELHDKYKAKYKRIYAEFLNGNISKEKFTILVKELRDEFRKELKSTHLKEKLYDTLKNCYRSLLKDLHAILTERQWKSFVECIKKE
jgi:hypothetical protein